MPDRSTIPMLPKEVPQQRIHLVVDVPARPEGLIGRCDYFERMPDGVRPKGAPRKVEFIGAVEWAFGPGSSRFNSYYLGRRGNYWLLWNLWLDETGWKERWHWSLYCYAEFGSSAPDAIAANLLLDAWKAEKDRLDLDHYFLIDQPGLLSIEQFSAIARQVWPEGRRRRRKTDANPTQLEDE